MTQPENNKDAASKLLDQAKEAESWKEWTYAYLDSLKSISYQFRAQNAPVSTLLIGLTVFVFSIQAFLYLLFTDSITEGVLILLTQRGALTGLTAWLFVNYPLPSWLLTEFLHKGIGHFIANIALLALFGKIIEPKFQKSHFILWFIGLAIIVKPSHAIISLSNSSKSNVAVYGISDFVYSLAVFSVLSLLNTDYRNELEYVALLVGGAAVLQVSVHVVQAMIETSIDPVNPAHLLGGIAGGIVFGIVRLR